MHVRHATGQHRYRAPNTWHSYTPLLLCGFARWSCSSVWCMQNKSGWLPTYALPTEKDDTKAEKQYYMVLTMAGHGIVEAVALKSGCNKTENMAELPFWFDRMVELGLGSEQLRDRLRQRVWKVRFTLRSSHVHVMLQRCEPGRVYASICSPRQM